MGFVQFWLPNWGWGLYMSKNEDHFIIRQHTWGGERIELPGKKIIEDGDIFGFSVDFDQRICKILYNGKVVGKGFTEIPDEIIPVICDDGGRHMKAEIQFVHGKRRKV